MTMLVTHAQIDHSVYLPLLVRNGYQGKVYCSQGTLDLCQIMLPDAGRLQEEEAGYANRRVFSWHKRALPLHYEQNAKRALKLLRPFGFGKVMDVQGVALSLQPSGHILGASMLRLQYRGSGIVFSGDLRCMQVSMMENISAHADAGEILQWLRGFDKPPRETFINHGEPDAADALRRDIQEGLGWKCRVPEYLEKVVLE